MKRPFLASRRTFARYVGSALAGAVLAPRAFAQTPVRVQRIGILSDFDGPTPQQVLSSPFRGALKELGYVEGKNIALVERYGAKGHIERLRGMVREIIEAKVDVITVFGGDVAIRAAQEATKTIPIVMAYGRDPVGVGFAVSLARPGGNITGVTIDVDPQENSKRVQFLKEAVPSMKTLMFIADAAWGDFSDRDPYVVAVKTNARSLGVVVTHVIVLTGAADVPAALDTVRKARPHALMIAVGPALNAHATRVHDFLRDARILKGANPAVMPIERPKKQELVLNRRTATALGLTFPTSLILSADEVVE